MSEGEGIHLSERLEHCIAQLFDLFELGYIRLDDQDIGLAEFRREEFAACLERFLVDISEDDFQSKSIMSPEVDQHSLLR